MVQLTPIPTATGATGIGSIMNQDRHYRAALRRARCAADRLDAATDAYCYRQDWRTELTRDQARASAMLAYLDVKLLDTRRQAGPTGTPALAGFLRRMRSLTADLADRAFGAGWND
jgi:hypothetical protein